MHAELEVLRTRAARLERLLEITAAVTATERYGTLLAEVIDAGKELMRCEACSLMLLDRARGELYFDELASDKDEALRSLRVPLGAGIAGHCAATGEIVLVNDVRADGRFYAKIDEESGFESRAILCVPLQARGAVTGILEAINPLDGGGFADEDVHLFQRFSSIAAVAIERIRAQRLAVERERLEHDLEIASRIQQHFLRAMSALPGRGMAWARAIPAREVGGDFYDFFRLGPERYGVVIGDVSGKGVAAALFMVKALSDFRWQALALQEVGPTIERVNQILNRSAESSMFVTALYVVWDPPAGTIEYANAGHLPLLIRDRRTGGVSVLEDGRMPPLGVFEDLKAKTVTRRLDPHEDVILVTDGVTEAVNAQMEEYGDERLLAFLRRAPATGIGQALVEEVLAWSGDAEREDDITVVTF